MRIVEASAELVSHTPEPAALIERMGRICYQSEPQGRPDDFVRMLIKRGHESVLEHASASFVIICDRGTSHEIVRHRLASYSQESTRYCNYSKEKFGGLRYYYQPSREDLREQLDKLVRGAELTCAVTCEVTGQPGRLMLKGGQRKTLSAYYIV